MKIWKISQISVSIPFSAFQDGGVGQPHPPFENDASCPYLPFTITAAVLFCRAN